MATPDPSPPPARDIAAPDADTATRAAMLVCAALALAAALLALRILGSGSV